MKFFPLFICVVLIGFLIWLNQTFVPVDALRYGGLSWIGWASILFVGFGAGLLFIFNDSSRAFGFFKARDEKANSGILFLPCTKAKTALTEQPEKNDKCLIYFCRT